MGGARRSPAAVACREAARGWARRRPSARRGRAGAPRSTRARGRAGAERFDALAIDATSDAASTPTLLCRPAPPRLPPSEAQRRRESRCAEGADKPAWRAVRPAGRGWDGRRAKAGSGGSGRARQLSLALGSSTSSPWPAVSSQVSGARSMRRSSADLAGDVILDVDLVLHRRLDRASRAIGCCRPVGRRYEPTTTAAAITGATLPVLTLPSPTLLAPPMPASQTS